MHSCQVKLGLVFKQICLETGWSTEALKIFCNLADSRCENHSIRKVEGLSFYNFLDNNKFY